MMSSKDSMALAVGQAMLDRIAASAPELSGVGDMDGDVIPADPDVDEPGTGVEPVKQTDKSTQTTDTRPNPLQEGNQTTHRHDSTVTASKEVA